MSSRFLKQNSRERSRPRLHECRFGTKKRWPIIALVIMLGVMRSACATAKEKAKAPEKHYIEPPTQAKIPASETALRVCADPNNLPFSNEKQEGFENKIAELIAKEMNRPVEYTWWAQRRGFFRNTLRAGVCDVVIGVPASFELAATTKPYYRSTYVFVTRADRDIHVESFDDPQLRDLTIGVQMIGDDGANSPPAHALSNRGIVANVRGYTVYGDYKRSNPPAQIIDAVLNKEVDVAVAWGPLAGYFANKHPGKLTVRHVSPEIDLPYLPFTYDIAVGIRRGEDQLKDTIEQILDRRRSDIDAILASYKVPRADHSLTQEVAR
jgi:mxaJ protein